MDETIKAIKYGNYQAVLENGDIMLLIINEGGEKYEMTINGYVFSSEESN